jgi:hypothetical protein
MNSQILELVKYFKSNSKKDKDRYKQFLIYVYSTLGDKIRVCKNKRKINKYKEDRINILKYIVTHEKQIIKELSK